MADGEFCIFLLSFYKIGGDGSLEESRSDLAKGCRFSGFLISDKAFFLQAALTFK